MSETPRTDAEIDDARNIALEFETTIPPHKEGENIYVVPADFARQLERELAAIKKELESAIYNQGCKDRDNDQLRAEHATLQVKHDEKVVEIMQLRAEVASLPGRWIEDSSLEKWFPITAEELKKLRTELHETQGAVMSLQLRCKEWREVAGMLANTVKQYQCSMFQPDTETYGNAVDALAAYERMERDTK